MITITPENINEILNDTDNYLFFYFTATWCGPCKRIASSIVKLDEGLTEKKIKFCKVDIDENDEFCEKCNIKSVPTFIIVKDKKIIGTVNGANIKQVGDLIKECCKDL